MTYINSGNIQNLVTQEEHVYVNGIPAKRVVQVDSLGNFVDGSPTSTSNPSLVLGYSGVNLVSITKTINGVSYLKILSYTGTDLTGVSEWSLVA